MVPRRYNDGAARGCFPGSARWFGATHPHRPPFPGAVPLPQVLRQALGASVWDAFFDPQGAVVPAERPELDPPVTSNKVRGPLSAQAKKIGAHAYYLIDHIFYNPGFFEFRSHAFEPKRFKSSKDALEDVQPCLLNPSDHYPVIVDLEWKGTSCSKHRCRTC